jgi:hypothetical protein
MGMKNSYVIFGLFLFLSSCVSRLTFFDDYNYKTIIDESPDKHEYNHFNNRSFDGLCEIEYGFLKNPGLIKAYNTDGTLTARGGPPFTFFVRLEEINRDIEYIKFDSIELATKFGTFDLLNLKDISHQTSIYYHGKIKEKNYDPDPFFWEMDDLKTLQRLKEERGINIIELRSKGIAEMEERIKRAEYLYNEEEKKMLLDERRCDFLFRIEHIPINVNNDEEVTVKVSLSFTMSNDDIQRIQFDNVYFREYSRISTSRLFFIEWLPEEKNVKF